MLPFCPKYRLGHPEKYLFLLSEYTFTGSKYPEKKNEKKNEKNIYPW